MAINKPTKPDVTLPDSFGGVHTAYTDTQIQNGYEDGIPQVVDGGNVNYEKDGLFKNNKYNRAVTDVLVDMPQGNMLTVDSNNRFDYIKNGNVGEILTSNGAGQLPSFKPAIIPDQAGQSGKFLRTDGTNTSWYAVESSFVDIESNQTVQGVKTFTNSPLMPMPPNRDKSDNKPATTGWVFNNALFAILPNYNAGIKVLGDGAGSYTFPTNGWALFYGFSGSICYINEAWVGYTNYDFSVATGLYPVQKDDVIRITSGRIHFYPLRGA